MWSIPQSNPEGRAFITIVIVFLFLALLALALRVYSRRLNEATLDASDYFCTAALILDVGLVVIVWGAFSHGWGEDISRFTLADARIAAWTFVAIEIVWNGATVAVRISMLLLYIRIFPIRSFRRICWTIAGLNAAIFISVVLATCLICRPITYSFDKTIPHGKCGDLDRFENYTAIVSLFADTTIVVLPMPMLWRLQMEVRKKVGISIILGMGTIICALTLNRVICSHYYYIHNYTKQAALIALITALEPIIGVINACLPFLPLVLKRLVQSPLFLNATTPFNSISISKRSNNKSYHVPNSSNGFARVNESASNKQGLRSDVEMSPIKLPSYGKTYVSTGSQNSIPESGPWDDLNDFRRQDHIFVRRVFSIE